MPAPAKQLSGVRNDVLLPDAVRHYVADHQLQQVVTTALNRVIQQMPVDPYARLAEELSKSSHASPRLLALIPDSSAARSVLRFDIVVATRGVRIRIHTLVLGDALLAPLEAAVEDGEAVPKGSDKGDDDHRAKKAHEEEKLVSFLQDCFCKSFGDVYVDDYLSFHERCEGFASAPLPGGATVDAMRATLSLTNQMLDAGVSALNTTCLDLVQRVLSRSGCSELVSPPLRGPQDFLLWRPRWPRFMLPLFHGGGPSILRSASLRCCVALSPLSLVAAAAPEPGKEAEEVEAETEDAQAAPPQSGWIAAVFEALQAAQGEAVKALQADKATAALVVEGLAYALPGGLVQTVQAAQKAAEAALTAAAGNSQEAYGVLFANAEEAWLEEEGVYEVETGKQMTLEELVELYAEVTEEGWIRTIVNPFREGDAMAGCELLHARRPELKLVQDYGKSQESPPEPPEDAAFSCLWHLAQTLPLVLRQYAQNAPAWREVADGLGHCTALEASAIQTMPALMEAIMACAEVQVVCLADDISAEDIKLLSDRNDEVLHRVHVLGGAA